MEKLQQFNASSMSSFGPFRSLVDPSEFLSHAVTLLLLGSIVVIAFISFEVTHKTNKSRSLLTEFSMAATASVLLGMGALMAMLAGGLYV